MKKLFVSLLSIFAFSTVYAQLEPYDDFETSDEVTIISTIKVSENMIPYYLEGLSKTWVAAQEYSLEKGYTTGYNIYVSDLPNSGEFNILLMVSFANDAAARGSEDRYKSVTSYMRENVLTREEQESIVTKDYPSMRKISGQYRIRSVTFKK